jgi:hypothetical protein
MRFVMSLTESSVYRKALLIFLSATVVIAADAPAYQKGTVTRKFAAESGSTAQAYYDLQGDGHIYQIKLCADYEDGKSVEFWVKGDHVFIRSEGGKDTKCSMAMVSGQPVSYKKGTVEGYDTRKDYYSNGNGTLSARKAKVYELHGADIIYKVDYCGMFQAGQFSLGQAVDYRVDGDRLYIVHDSTKEYSCKIEGTRLPEGVKPPSS